MNKEKFIQSIFKFNCNYNEYTPLQLVQTFVANKQGITLKSNCILCKVYETQNMQMTLYLQKHDKKGGVKFKATAWKKHTLERIVSVHTKPSAKECGIFYWNIYFSGFLKENSSKFLMKYSQSLITN